MELIDFGALQIGGVTLILLILGWVEAAKRLGIKDRGSFIMALVCGCLFAGLWQAMNTGLVPEVALPWIRVVVVGLGGGIATTGLYDIGKKVLAGVRDYTTRVLSGGVSDPAANGGPIWDRPTP